MNTKGQSTGGVNIFQVLFVIIIFVSMMALGFGSMINEMIGIGVTAGNVNGVEAFFLNNMVLWIILIFILWVIVAMGQT